MGKHKNGVLLTAKELMLLCVGDEETINMRFRTLLKEERGIADEVSEYVNQLYDKISSNAREVTKNKTYQLTDDFNGKRIRFAFTVFVCKSKKEESELISTNENASNSYSIYRGEGNYLRDIYAPLVFVGGNLDYKKFYDDLQHEVQHIFQQDMIGNEYKNPLLNAIVNSNIYSEIPEKRNPARLLYYSNPVEQDAFANGLYGYVMSSLQNNEFPIEKSNIDAFVAYRELCKAYKYLLDNRNNEKLLRDIQTTYVAKGYNYTYHRLKERGRDAINDFEHKLSRTIRKCEMDAAKLGISVTDTEHWLI